MKTEQILDGAALQRLKDWGGEELLDELLEIFYVDPPKRFAAAQEALAIGDLEAAGDAIHALRSSAGNLGCLRMEAEVTAFLKDARAGRGDHLEATLARLQEAYDEVVQVLRAKAERPA